MPPEHIVVLVLRTFADVSRRSLPLNRASTITNTDGSTWVTDYKFNDNPRFFHTNELGQITGGRVGPGQAGPNALGGVWRNPDWNTAPGPR